MKKVSVKLPSPLAAKWSALACKRKTSESALIRQAMEAFLAAQKQHRPGSLLKRIRDLVGCFEGPGDLSCNKEHVRDFAK